MTSTEQIRSFWQSHPCGDHQVGGLNEAHRGDYERFFSDYDRMRYRKEGHILRCLDAINFQDKHVLEIGLGQGADSEQLIRRGARWTGLDLTDESIARVRTRLALRNLPHQDLRQGSALDMPFDNDRFDIVFTHGVLHHIPDVGRAQREIARVLKPDGRLIMMVYARWSLNYLVAIGLVRRAALAMCCMTGLGRSQMVEAHRANARNMGLARYLRMNNFIHHNTDGPGNPYSRVYSLAEVRRTFTAFEVETAYKQFMHAPPLPVRWLPLAGMLGWHLWVHLRPKASTS